ncbi:MAG: phosphonate metabolism protein PhnH, partial [Rhizobium sp.]
ARAIRYPLGWDLYLVDGKRLFGIPRSTKIEVL